MLGGGYGYPKTPASSALYLTQGAISPNMYGENEIE